MRAWMGHDALTGCNSLAIDYFSMIGANPGWVPGHVDISQVSLLSTLGIRCWRLVKTQNPARPEGLFHRHVLARC